MRRSEIQGFILPFAKPSSVACITFISAADITTYPALLQMQKQQYNLPLLALIIVSLLNANHRMELSPNIALQLLIQI